MRRGITLLAIAAMLLAAMAAPAAATKAPAPGADPAEGHKITICHATRSLSNPYVEITIDVTAWNNPDDPNHHGNNHTRTKNDNTWTDIMPAEGEDCPAVPPHPPPPPNAFCDSDAIEILFDGDKLISNLVGGVNQYEPGEFGVDIPPGDYMVLLGSSDPATTLVQRNEQWRASFNSGDVVTGFSEDLDDSDEFRSNETNVGTFAFSGYTTVVAEHWSVANTSLSPDSVIPTYVCLLESNDL